MLQLQLDQLCHKRGTPCEQIALGNQSVRGTLRQVLEVQPTSILYLSPPKVSGMFLITRHEILKMLLLAWTRHKPRP